MADLTDRAKDMALAIMFADATIGLTRDNKEIDDAGYVRRPLDITDPRGVARGLRAVHNEGEIRFGPWEIDAPGEVTGWFVGGAKGVMASGAFERQRRPLHGDELVIHEGEVVLGLR